MNTFGENISSLEAVCSCCVMVRQGIYPIRQTSQPSVQASWPTIMVAEEEQHWGVSNAQHHYFVLSDIMVAGARTP